MRDSIAKGDFPGPRMFVAGAYLTITGGGGAVTGFAPDVTLPWDLRYGVADGADQVRQRVRDIAAQGVDLIKILATGAFLTHGSDPHAVEYGYDEVRAAVEEAAHKGLKVAAHAHSADGIKIAVRAGVASIEHGTYLDDEGIRMMKERGTYLVADIYDAEWIRQGAKAGYPGLREQAARGGRAAAAGVPQGREGGRQDRLRHRRERVSARVERAPVRLAGPVRSDADGGDPLGDGVRGGPDRARSGHRDDRSGEEGGPDRRRGRPARRRVGPRKGGLRHEGRRRLQGIGLGGLSGALT